jgi:DNA polymerase IV
MSQRVILHVDMDAFFASVEVLDDPSLRGKPVIVGGSAESRGVVSAASYEARRFGVHSAMSAARARQLCPQGVFITPQGGRYSEISRQVFEIFTRYTPLVEPLSIDEAFLDVTGCRRLFGDGPEIGRRIKAEILDEIGLVASVGVAPNKFLAKLASDMEKPDGFVVLAFPDVLARLAALPIGRMWGVGGKSQARLQGIGVQTFGDLYRVPRGVLEHALGEHGASRLLRLGRGEDERPVITDHDAKSIGNEITFAEDIADGQQLVQILYDLSDKVAWRLRRAEVKARTVSLKARYADFTTVTRAQTLDEPTNATADLRRVGRDLFLNHLDRGGRPLRLIGLTGSGLDDRQAVQTELFVDTAKEHEKSLDAVMDRVTEKYGRGVVKRGLRGRKKG